MELTAEDREEAQSQSRLWVRKIVRHVGLNLSDEQSGSIAVWYMDGVLPEYTGGIASYTRKQIIEHLRVLGMAANNDVAPGTIRVSLYLGPA